jgi:N-acetyl sugar amidotransferase
MMKILDSQLEKLPKEVVFCKKCVVSNQRPRTIIDAEGICNACRYSEEKEQLINWQEREAMLTDLLNRHRSKDGRFDVIVPSSGGKDSGYVVHQLKHRYGMHPLTITWAPFIYSDIGWKNYVALIHSGFNNMLFYPNGKLHRKLARIAFECKGDHWEPFAFGQKSLAFQIAVKFGIPLIFYGENGEIEYGGSGKNKDKPYESVEDWDELYFKGTGVDALIKEGLEHGIFAEDEVRENPLEMYKAPPLEEIHKIHAEMHWYSFYHKWIPQEHYYYVAANCGFEANPDGRSEGTYSKYSSLDDKTDGFHWYLSHIKFGLGRASREAQMEIRHKHLTREEGVALVRRYDGEFPKKWFPDFLEYLDIAEEHFWDVIDKFRQPHVWKYDDGVWKLRKAVYDENGTSDGIASYIASLPESSKQYMGKKQTSEFKTT